MGPILLLELLLMSWFRFWRIFVCFGLVPVAEDDLELFLILLPPIQEGLDGRTYMLSYRTEHFLFFKQYVLSRVLLLTFPMSTGPMFPDQGIHIWS